MKTIMYFHHGDISGGAANSLKLLLSKISEKQCRVVLVCRDKAFVPFFEQDNIEIVAEEKIKPFHGSVVSGMSFKQFIYNLVYAWPTYFAAKRLIKKYKPNIVHLNSTCLFMVARATKKTNKSSKIICHIREPLLPNFFGNILKKECHKYVDRYIAIDEFDGRSVNSKLENTTVIFNFVDFNIFNYNLHSKCLYEELKIPVEDNIFTAICRVSPENGVLELIKEWANLISENNKHLIICGYIPGREVDYLNKCRDEIQGHNIHLLPFRKDIPNVIASSTALICPFIAPHFARMIIEGNAMGKITISNYIEGPKELIQEDMTGLFFSYNSSDNRLSLEAAMNLACDEKKRSFMEYNAFHFAKENFSLEKNSDMTFSLYEFDF